ncbi:MAG TPA: hypothetical protein PLW98_10090 [Bacillota bacterium]|nr:hypothetical protein [Bacillota bacterium]
MVTFASGFYVFARVMSYLTALAVVILMVRGVGMDTTSSSGDITYIHPGGGFAFSLLVAGLALGPMLAFDYKHSELIFAYGFYIILLIKAVSYFFLLRFVLRFAWIGAKLQFLLPAACCILGAAWCARSLELMVCLFRDSHNPLLRLLIVIGGIVYIVLYFCLDIALLVYIGERPKHKISSSELAFLRKKFEQGNPKTRQQVLEILGEFEAEPAYLFLLQQAESNTDMEIKRKALDMLKKKNLDPELSARLQEIQIQHENEPLDSSPAKFCSYCGNRITGDETCCTQCSKEAQEAPPAETHYAPVKELSAPAEGKTGLRGLAKAWVIILFVYSSYNWLMLLISTAYYQWTAPILLIAGGIVAGLALILWKRPYGFWVMIASVLLLVLYNAIRFSTFNIYFLVWPMLAFLTWLFTHRQIDYRFTHKN